MGCLRRLAPQAVPPHTFSQRELEVAGEVYTTLVTGEGDARAKRVAAVLEHDVTAERVVCAHVGTMLAPQIISYLESARKRHPEAAWGSALARDLLALATVGDLQEPATVAAIAQAMEQLGGSAPPKWTSGCKREG